MASELADDATSSFSAFTSHSTGSALRRNHKQNSQRTNRCRTVAESIATASSLGSICQQHARFYHRSSSTSTNARRRLPVSITLISTSPQNDSSDVSYFERSARHLGSTAPEQSRGCHERKQGWVPLPPSSIRLVTQYSVHRPSIAGA